MNDGLLASSVRTGRSGSEQIRNDVLLRLARADEYPAIDRLVTEAYVHDYGSAATGGDPLRYSEIRAREHEVWVAVDTASPPDGDLLGTITLRAPEGPSLHEDSRADELDLRLLAVSPRARRRGFGRALMGLAVRRAQEGGFTKVLLKTAPHMHGAHRLYEALGFTRAPERDGLWLNGKKLRDLYTYLSPLHSRPVASAPPPPQLRNTVT